MVSSIKHPKRDRYNSDRIDFLGDLLNRVDGWLRYAEAKNGVLLTLSSAAVGVALRIGFDGCFGMAAVSYWAGILLCLAAMAYLISSFVPRLDSLFQSLSRPFKVNQSPPSNPNLIFFGDISSIPISEFAAGLSNRLGIPTSQLSNLENDFIQQIHINSIIASRKFQFFGPSVVLFSVGLVLIILGLVFESAVDYGF